MRKHQVFAMDTCFHNSIVGTYPYDVRCEMLVELGFDAIYVSLQPDGLHHADRMAATKNQYGLEVVAAYAGLDVIAAKDDPKNHEVSELFQRLPYGCDLELTLITSDQSVKPSSIDIDHLAIERLKPLLEVAEKQQAHVCLYPHFGAWLERVEDGIRLCENMEHPALKLVFCGFHWYAVEGSNLSQSISSAIPYLHSVNICGSSREGDIAGCTIEPLDSGDMDNFSLLGCLHRCGYTGRIGFQGYGIGGDVYTNLQRSMNAFRSMEKRLSIHPNWGGLI